MKFLGLLLLSVALLGAAAPNGCMRWMNGGPTGDQMPWATGGGSVSPTAAFYDPSWNAGGSAAPLIQSSGSAGPP